MRYRLLGLALLPTMILVPALLGLGAMWWVAQIDDLLISKVNGDLTVARQYLNEIVEQGDNRVVALAHSAALFGTGELTELSVETLGAALREAGAVQVKRGEGMPGIVDLFVETGLVASKGAARRTSSHLYDKTYTHRFRRGEGDTDEPDEGDKVTR